MFFAMLKLDLKFLRIQVKDIEKVIIPYPFILKELSVYLSWYYNKVIKMKKMLNSGTYYLLTTTTTTTSLSKRKGLYN